MKGKKLGVLGGMGPMATSVYLEKLIQNTKAEKDQDHIDTIIINHATIPDRTESILANDEDKFLNAIQKDIALLEMAEVENIAIPCNTSHYFFDKMQEMTNIHIINMVEKTIEYIQKYYGNGCKVGILATDGTIATRIYQKACDLYKLESYHPAEEVQKKVMEIIYHFKAGVSQSEDLEEIIKHMIFEQNCTCVILGCTELSCININDNYKEYTIDPMDILVKESIIRSGKKYIQH